MSAKIRQIFLIPFFPMYLSTASRTVEMRAAARSVTPAVMMLAIVGNRVAADIVEMPE
jgi:hypothetical protein